MTVSFCYLTECRKGTFQHHVWKREQEERSSEVLPVGRLILWLVVPQLQSLQHCPTFIARKHLSSSLRNGTAALTGLETLLSVIFNGVLAVVIHHCTMLGPWELITLVE